MRDRIDLFVVSVLVLFLELACIRWFPAHVLFLTFFTNTVLLACFLGMSTGCLAARHRRNHLIATPILLALALGAAQLVEWQRQRTGSAVLLGDVRSPQMVFFGAEYALSDPSAFIIPIEAILAAMFVMIALAMFGPGQQLGRCLSRVPDRVQAYTINIAGSLAGIGLFTACSWWRLAPVWWFAIVLAGLGYLLRPARRVGMASLAAGSAAVTMFAAIDFAHANPQRPSTELWSPYYRIHHEPDRGLITVNLIGHQQMISRQVFSPAYALPHLLNRDAGRPPFRNVLIIGAGSGNDVSRALEWGAHRVDAVEIDPVIQDIGRRFHPDQPYADPRVTVHLADGRNFLRSSTRQYDLIIYALVDSLVLHSSYSNIRLESYLFTQQAFDDVRTHLMPGGLFVMYNYFRQGWIVSRITTMLERSFGPGNPLVFHLPGRDSLHADDVLFGEFTVLFTGNTDPLRGMFAKFGDYTIPKSRASDRSTPNGFTTGDDGAAGATTQAGQGGRGTNEDDGLLHFRPTNVTAPDAPLRRATDSWPFLYLRQPTIPVLNLRGMAIMAALAVAFLAPLLRRTVAALPRGGASHRIGFLAQMFFLGAGFMLVETKAVVQMALLFGSTWVVNSIVFAAVLAMILVANLFVLLRRPQSLTPFYLGLVLALAVSALVPMDAFLGWPPVWQIVGSCALAFTPILFAGIVFATAFSRAVDADLAFGANIAGAMAGGLAEYSSMLIGFQYVVIVAVVFYALAAFGGRRDARALAAASGT